MTYQYLKNAMAVVIRDVVGDSWGFFSREDQRMHLQTTKRRKKSNLSKVWLERRGVRCFEKATWRFSQSEFRELQQTVEENRYDIEVEWIDLMVEKGWMKIQGFDHTRQVILLEVYTDHNKFIREVDLKKIFPGRYHVDQYRPYTAQDIQLDRVMKALSIGENQDRDHTHHILLVDVVFQDP